jgi:hypothetical protein
MCIRTAYVAVLVTLLLCSLRWPAQAQTVRGEPAVLSGAGDIAVCGYDRDEQTAALLDTLPGVVFTLGDNVYSNGTAEDFATCYDPSWGRHKARTHPAPGNHDYITAGAQGYFDYFGAAARPEGFSYYSYTSPGWLILSLNSNIDVRAEGRQGQWLRATLEQHRDHCVLAYWHHPLFTSLESYQTTRIKPLWNVLYAYGADIVLNGHAHFYERFAPQTPDGEPDSQHGIRQFIVGTGGAYLYDPGEYRAANSEALDIHTHGVISFHLFPDKTYTWEFIPVEGQSFTDRGQGKCVEPSPKLPRKN